MPSNQTFVCVPCRKTIRRAHWFVEWVPRVYHTKRRTFTYGKVYRSYGVCPSCGGRMEGMGNWSPPKKNNDRAWKRIASGDKLWDHRRTRRRNMWNAKHHKTTPSPDLGG